MVPEVTPFVASSKDWIISKSVISYLRARNMFANVLRNLNGDRQIEFQDLLKLTETLEEIKDDLHLIFKRMVNPQENIFENAAKYQPAHCELQYRNNVGLLYHKSMVARELKYLMAYYKEDSAGYFETRLSFRSYINRINRLFIEGMIILQDLMIFNRKNTLLMMFLLENSHYVESAFNQPMEQLLRQILGHNDLSEAYLQVGKYYYDSGWYPKARKMFMDGQQINPGNAEINQFLQKFASENGSQ